MNIIGLDIGTTTISAVVLDSDSGETLRALTQANDSALTGRSFERLQNPKVILKKCEALIEALTRDFAPVAAIGVTGQMHGILYVNPNGDPVSPLWYWQDMSGEKEYRGSTYAAVLSDVTGYKAATGFGLTTCYYHTVNSEIPAGAAKLCTIHDFVAMRLCGLNTPLVHSSDAASLGLYDLKNLRFDEKAVEAAGINPALLPLTCSGFETVGLYGGKIPVSVAIGDNQASYIGSVSDAESSLLVNIGTGSQISFMTGFAASPEGIELRPCFGDRYICVGSALCGGRAFAMLEQFLRECAELVTGEKVKSAYPAIDAFLASGRVPEDVPTVSTRFSGTRENPDIRGHINGIGTENFTPECLILGVLGGIVEELRTMYSASGDNGRTLLVGSGNGLRKNSALQKLFSREFAMPLRIPVSREEAAFGAALFGMTAAGIKSGIADAQKLIKYTL